MNGFGRLNFITGDIYDGELEEGYFSGEGIFYKKENDKYVFGMFEKN